MRVIIPYVTTPMEKVNKMVEFAQVKKGQKSVDLGAGDGRVVIAMARAGAEAYGFEIIQKYVRRAKANIAREGLADKAFIHQTDFWNEDLSIYDVVTVYPMAILMEELGKKLTRELRPGTRVVSNGFKIPNWKEVQEDDHLFFYIKDAISLNNDIV